MGGGLMQLVAYGAQDIYLTGNPQITFWKVVYRRHTNFARESIEQTVSGSSTLSSGNRGTVTISRNGDLLSGVHVVSTGALAGAGDNAIVDVEVQIGGQKIDKHTKEWMQIWAELSTPDSKADAYRAMTGVSGTQGSSGTGVYATHIPLQFWFCRNPGLALPLIALQYHEVKVVFNWGTAGDGAQTAKVYCDYVYLDTDERRRFAQVSHEYLIEQLQYQTEGTSKASYKLTLNHPVKALYWTDADAISTETMKLKLNGHDRFAAREKEYFQLQQPMGCHTAVPRQNLPVVQTPELLATPINVSSVPLIAEADTSPADGGAAVVTNVLYLHAGEAQSGFAVGDVLHLVSVVEDAGVPQATGFDVYSIITAVTSTSQFTLNSCPNTVAQAGGVVSHLYISKVASVKNSLCRTSSMTRKINMYSFALEPEEHQPSGTCNFSRIDTATLELSSAQQVEAIYALNYNVLRIMSGMGGLAYSN
jgi:hypothetical protein